MKTRLLMVALPFLVGLLAVACVVDPTPTPEPPAAPPQAPPPAPLTPTPTLSAAATPPPLPIGPEELLESVKAAMAALGSFHLEGEVTVKTNRQADAALVSIQFVGAGEKDGDSQLQVTMDIQSGDFAGTLTFEEREVQGVNYAQDPFTGEWAIADTGDSGSGSFEQLVPEGMVATGAEAGFVDGLRVYNVIGTVPDDPEREHIVLWVGIDDFLVRQMLVQGIVPATDYEGLVPQDSEDLYQSSWFNLSRFNEPVRVAVPPLEAPPTLAPSCPAATPEPFRVDPVISPTNELSQVINVSIGNGASVTITSESGTVTDTEPPFSLDVTLVPDSTNHLEVVAWVETIRHGGCTYGGYPLTKQLVIEQRQLQPPDPTTPTPTPTPTLPPGVTTLTWEIVEGRTIIDPSGKYWEKYQRETSLPGLYLRVKNRSDFVQAFGDYLELRSNGTYELSEGGQRVTGQWHGMENEIVLTPES